MKRTMITASSVNGADVRQVFITWAEKPSKWGAKMRDGRFTPKSGHWDSAAKCPLCARSRLMQCSKKVLFNHLVSECKKRFRNLDAERLGDCDINDKLDFGRLLDRNIAGLRPA